MDRTDISRFLNLKRTVRSVLYIYIFLILAFAIMAISFPLFVSQRNLSNLLIQIAPLAIVAIGQTIVIIGGGVDLSVGTVVSLTSVIAAYAMGPSPMGVLSGLGLIFLLAVLVGLANGIVCNETNIPPLIVTLCTSGIIQGSMLWYRESPGGKVPEVLTHFLIYRFSIFSVPVLVFAILYVLFVVIMRSSVFGLYIYAIGGNEEYARMAGINVKRVRTGTYVLCSVLSSIAGLIVASRINSGSPLVGDAYQLDSLTAVLIGGTPFAGGQGILIGSFAGASVVAMMRNALNISGVSPFYQYLAKGALLIIAMIANSWKKASK